MIRIANGCGFWGDSPLAPKELLEKAPDIDYLTLEYLAELTLSILSTKKVRYCADFLDVLKSLPPFKCKIITNAGGLDPMELARECKKIFPEKIIGVVLGDDVTDRFDAQANVYLGAKGIIEALSKGAQIVITGRVADPSLTVAPCVYHFGWKEDDWNKIAQATVAGHLIECGAQATGGIFTNWLQVPQPEAIGYPIVEMKSDASFVITKPQGSGGMVTLQTVKEQLLYELFDPDHYLSPDATVSFTTLCLQQEGKDRVSVVGAKGSPPPSTYKVSLARPIGFKLEAMLAFFGEKAREKGVLAGEAAVKRVKNHGFSIQDHRVEVLGLGDVVPLHPYEGNECVIRIAAFDSARTGLEALAKEIAPLVTRGPQGITGYATGRAKVKEVAMFQPKTLPRNQVHHRVEIL
jgi:hypothetical protein